MKTAIVFFNLGGPDELSSVKPFLFNLFNDPNIIGAPTPIRYLLAKFISWRRAPVAQEIYSQMGGKSPIVEETAAQAEALEQALAKHGEIKVFFAMRYWHPRAQEVAGKVAEYNPDHVIMLPLYPQFSTTTTESSFKEWYRECNAIGFDVPTTEICCYPTSTALHAAHAARIKELYFRASEHGTPRILFSAHGLPEKIIAAGDPYQYQVEQTVAGVVNTLNIPKLDYRICYQSRVGPLKWIGPSTEDEIMAAGKDEVPLIVLPIAFVSEHSETLVELDIEYRELAEEYGIKEYFRVPALGVQEHFIDSLKTLCLNVSGEDTVINSEGNTSLCPETCSQCRCRRMNAERVNIAEEKNKVKEAA
jgi:ferrochelatase